MHVDIIRDRDGPTDCRLGYDGLIRTQGLTDLKNKLFNNYPNLFLVKIRRQVMTIQKLKIILHCISSLKKERLYTDQIQPDLGRLKLWFLSADFFGSFTQDVTHWYQVKTFRFMRGQIVEILTYC